MALKELLGKMSVDLEVKGVKIRVDPLTLSDIGELMNSNGNDLKNLFNASKGIKEILSEMPSLAYNVIAVSTKESAEDVAKLPIGVQLQLLEKVVDVSEISSDAMGKLVARLVNGLQVGMGMLTNQVTSKTGQTRSKKQLDDSLKKATESQT